MKKQIMVVTGKTFLVKNFLKECGFKFDFDNKVWSAPINDIDEGLLNYHKNQASVKRKKLFEDVQFQIM